MKKNKRTDDRFTREQYLLAFRLPQDKIVLEMTNDYIKSVCDFDMDDEAHRMVGYAIEHKFLDFLGDNYVEGIKYQTDYMSVFGDEHVHFELKTSEGSNLTLSKSEWSDHHPKINPYYICATTESLGDDKYSFYIDNVVIFSDIYPYLLSSKFDETKFIPKSIIKDFK